MLGRVRHYVPVALHIGGWLRVAEAAVELEVSQPHIRLLIARGQLRAERLGPRMLLVERSSVEAYKHTRRRPGRPRREFSD